MKSLFVAFCACALALPAFAASPNQFRGPNRDGHFAAENLLDSWPETGPQMKWHLEDLGKGYASMSIAEGLIFTTGVVGETEKVFAINLDGKVAWQKEIGKAHHGSGYPGSRNTPTYDEGHIYVWSSMGVAICYTAKNGEEVWRRDMVGELGGENPKSLLPYFGMAESLLVDGDRVICTPGAKDAAVVALDKKTGKTVWQSSGLSDKASYCAARIMETGKHRQIVTMTSKAMVGLDPKSGDLLWRFPYPAEYDIHAVSPVFKDGMIYVSDGYKQGGTMLKLKEDGKGVEKAWTEDSLDVHHGGLVLLDNRIYGAASDGEWKVLDMKTGKVLAAIEKRDSPGKGSVVFADGMLYGYGEKGKLGLIDPKPSNFKVVSMFEIEMGSGQHWSHPVVYNGTMYVRHGEVLMAYNVAKN